MASVLAVPVGRRIAGVTDQPEFDPAGWPDLDVGALDADALTEYLLRKTGVLQYLAGASEDELRRVHRMGTRYLNRLVRDRCNAPHPDGGIYGWRGLVKHRRVKAYVRQLPVKPDADGRGSVGALGAMLLREPGLAVRFERCVLKSCADRRLGQSRRPRHVVWAWFLAESRKLGFDTRNEWPFTVQTMGYSSVVRFIDKTLAAHPSRAASVVGGPEGAKKMLAGDGVGRPMLAPFERVEMDAHKLDCRICILMPQPSGGWAPKIVHRLWVTVILDVASRAVLGYYLSLGREVTKDDVLRTIKCALSPWVRPEISYSPLAFVDEAGLPSSHHAEYVGLCWDETSVDGALAETCKTVVLKLEAVVGSRLRSPAEGYSARRSKDDRPFVESFFRALSARGLGRLSNSTGAKPGDKQGRDPDAVAKASQFQLPYLEELLAVLIANYNATPHSGLGHRSPLSQLDYFRATGRLPKRRADPSLVQGLLSVRKTCVVRGGYAQGRAPYVNFHGVRYSNETLAGRHDLVGKHIHVVNHLEDDARVALACTQDGLALGVLRAAPPWHRLPHSLAVRSAIQTLVRERMFTIASGGDAITTFVEFAESQQRGRLPVHPAYLAVQRVLAEHARRADVDERVEEVRTKLAQAALAETVERARTPGSTSSSSIAAPSEPGISKPPVDEVLSIEPLQDAAGARGKPEAPSNDRPRATKPLPARRMAANT